MSSEDSKIIDRSYRLHEQLGQGGMGAVYRASQLLTGRVVALKLVTQGHAQNRTVGATEAQSLRLALAREFQTLAALHHPNVIRVLDYGFDETLGPYFTMELLHEPQDLLSAAAQQSLEGKVVLIAQLLRALVYVHQRGILHRDIKPSNVLVVDGEVKLLDFGIASQSTSDFELAGTLEYMAPELLLGQPPSARSDLYSVGILLHQILTGNFPYSRDSMTHMLYGLLGEDSENTFSTAVASLLDGYRRAQRFGSTDGGGFKEDDTAVLLQEETVKQLSDDIPATLAAIVHKLVARRPEERPDGASAALTELAATIKTPVPLETEATRESFLQATHLVGRESELQYLLGALSAATGRRGRGILIGGESGVGKSRLISELRTLALVRGFWVAAGQSTREHGEYYQEWLPVVRALCFRCVLSDEELSAFKMLIPGIGELLGKEVRDLPPASPEQVQLRIVSALVAVLERLGKPLLLLLEDLHWAHSESVELLRQICSHLERWPVLVVGTYRSDELPELSATLAKMTHLELSRLNKVGIGKLSVAILGPAGQRPELIEYLARQTDGNAFFAVEVLRALAEDAGTLEQIGQGALPDSILTTGIERILERRLDRLPMRYRAWLEFAAIYGRNLDMLALKHAYQEIPTQDFLNECANAMVLESQGRDWRFVHDKMREALVGWMDQTRYTQLHREVGETIEVVYTENERESMSAALADHFRIAGVLEKSLEYYILAGDLAKKRSLYGIAKTHYATALRLTNQLPDSVRMRRFRADLRLRQVDIGLLREPNQQLLDWLSEARTFLVANMQSSDLSVEDRLRIAKIEHYNGRVHYYGGRSREAIRCYQSVLSTAKEFADNAFLALPAFETAQALISQGRFLEVNELLSERRESILSYFGVSSESIRCIMYAGISLIGTGHYQEAIEKVEQARLLAQQLEQPVYQANFIANESVVYFMMADWAKVVMRTENLLELANHMKDSFYLIAALDSMAWAQSYLEQHEMALANRARAAKLRQDMGINALSDWFAAAEAEILLNAGRTEAALQQAQKVAVTSQEAGLLLSWSTAERVWGCALARLGHTLTEAEPHFVKSLEICRDAGQVINAAQTELWWGRSCYERGSISDARRHLNIAIKEFESRSYTHALAHAYKIYKTIS